MKFVRIRQIRTKFVRMWRALSANFTRISRFVRNSCEIRTKFVRISYEFPKFPNLSKKSTKFT